MHKESKNIKALWNCWLILSLLVFSNCQNFYCQNENKKWFFGNKAALDFISNPPNPIIGSAMTFSLFNEGTASVADAVGNLLFYTDGITIWNKAHQVMANGTGLTGGSSTTQAALIVKQPGNTNMYFVFSLSQMSSPSGLCYSMVDMNLAVGMGSVTAKNILIKTPSTEKLHGTKHCNGIDTWVVSHDYNSNVFRSVLVTSSGVTSSATLSAVGTIINTPIHTLGSIKISPSGKKMGCTVYDVLGSSYFELYDFDNSTGLVSNPLILTINDAFAYNCEFSPDETKFYGSMDNLGDTIYQWDLCAGSPQAINSSRFPIVSTHAEGIQLSTNGKIYVARLGEQTLGVINDPNLLGSACNYIDQAQSVAPNFCSLGLPNFIQGISRPAFSYTITPSISCGTATFSAPPPPTTTTTACGTVGYNVISFAWSFGDIGSGALNTSTLNNPAHTYPGQGTYTVSLIYYYNGSCGPVSDTLKQEIKVGVLPISSSIGFNACNGQPLTLSASGAQTYSWNTGATTPSISVSPTVSTSYTLFATDTNGCAYKNIQLITVYNYPLIGIRGSTLICPGFQAQLTATGAATYSWVNGPNTSIYSNIPTANTTYTVFGSTNNCTSQKTISIVLGRPPISILGDTVVCPGTALTLSVNGSLFYTWNDGSNGNSTIVTPTASTIYTVHGIDNKGCTNTASLLVRTQLQQPSVNFTYSSPVCKSATNLTVAIGQGFTPGGFYSSDGLAIDALSGAVDLSQADTGSYVINYFLPETGCFSAANSTAALTVLPSVKLNLGPDHTIAPGSSIQLSVTGAVHYSWTPTSYLSCTNCPEPVATPPANTEYCVVADVNSCLSKACITVFVSCESPADYSLPNAFTPNGDGKNDVFCLQGWGACITDFKILVFDAWGEKVFESSDPGFCWDGIYNGKALSAGVFVYIVNAKKFDNTGIAKKGNISLIR